MGDQLRPGALTQHAVPMKAAQAVAVLALAAGAWLLWRDGGVDTYRAPVFWPFLFVTGLMVTFSTSSTATEPRSWRGFVALAAIGAALVAGVVATLAANNPINDIHVSDIAALAGAAAVLVVAAGAATEIGERASPGTWVKMAACLAACLLTMTVIPRALLALR
jgi:hypothetical protein